MFSPEEPTHDRPATVREAPGDPGLHRPHPTGARVPALGARDLRGRGADVDLDGPRPPVDAPEAGLPPAGPDQAEGDRGALRLVVGDGTAAATGAPRAPGRRR